MTQHTDLIERLRYEPTASQYLSLPDLIASLHEDRKNAATALEAQAREIEGLHAALKPFADFEAVRSTMGASSPKSGLLWAVHSRAGSAEISVEDMQAAIRALNTEGEGHDAAMAQKGGK